MQFPAKTDWKHGLVAPLGHALQLEVANPERQISQFGPTVAALGHMHVPLLVLHVPLHCVGLQSRHDPVGLDGERSP